jgi:DNA-binding PadR family transcriptional regulator
MSEQDKALSNAIQEMRRGTLVLAVLLELDEPQYGYSLIEALASKGLSIEQNTLYPLMRRLEKMNLLDSTWQLEENRPRRYYQINEQGRLFRDQLTKEWRELTQVMTGMLHSKS